MKAEFAQRIAKGARHLDIYIYMSATVAIALPHHTWAFSALFAAARPGNGRRYYRNCNNAGWSRFAQRPGHRYERRHQHQAKRNHKLQGRLGCCRFEPRHLHRQG
jgi:hypothetical protein